MNEATINNLIDVLGRAKDLRRTGWLRRNIPSPESDGDHMFSTAFLVLVLAQNHQVNVQHCLELALTHDLQETIAGDPVPGEKTVQEKYESELAAISQIADKLAMPQLIEWFKEFEARETEEAKFVKNLDKLDTMLTAAYYDRHRNSEPKVWEEFSRNGLNFVREMPSCITEEICELIPKIKV